MMDWHCDDCKKYKNREKMKFNITKVKFKSLKTMEYETLGNYHSDGTIEVYSGMDDVEKTAVAIHELVEFTILKLQGVSAEQVTKWDTEDSNGAFNPDMYKKDKRYAKAHKIAETVEREIIKAAGRTWKEYSNHVDNMPIKYKYKR